MAIYFIIAILFASIYIGVELLYKPLFAFFFKALASVSFVVLGMLGYLRGQHSFIILIVIGLIFGLIGDLILALRPLRPKEDHETIIIAGIISFATGHIFYLLLLLELSSLSYLSIIISITITALVIIGSYLMKFNMGKTRIPSYIYSLLIFLMIGQAISLYLEPGENIGVLMILVGAILFGISDLILAPIYYKDMNSKLMISLNLKTYYAAQILIAYSIFFL